VLGAGRVVHGLVRGAPGEVGLRGWWWRVVVVMADGQIHIGKLVSRKEGVCS
jgi:hypothetical protein